MYLENDYDKFYDQVLKERQQYLYPPFCRLCEIVIKSKDETLCHKSAQQLFQFLIPYFGEYALGPIRPYVSKINNYYLQHILLKIPLNKSYQQFKKIILQQLQKVQNNKVIVDIIVDV